MFEMTVETFYASCVLVIVWFSSVYYFRKWVPKTEAVVPLVIVSALVSLIFSAINHSINDTGGFTVFTDAILLPGMVLMSVSWIRDHQRPRPPEPEPPPPPPPPPKEKTAAERVAELVARNKS